MRRSFVQKRFFFGLSIVALLLFAGSDVSAQSDTPRYEVGAQFSLIRFGDLDITEPGFGGRFTYNINDHLAVEAEGNFFHRNAKSFGGFVLQGGRKIEALFGVKAGVRTRRLGVFGKVRPGFVHFSNFEKPEALGIVCAGSCTVPAPPFNFSETDVAVDLGGVIELYPSRRTIVRFDVGDTIVHSGSGKTIVLPGITQFPGFTSPTKDIVRSTSHNLQFSIGIGFRF